MTRYERFIERKLFKNESNERRIIKIGYSYEEYKRLDKEMGERKEDDVMCVFCRKSCIERSNCGRYMAMQGSWGRSDRDEYIEVIKCCDRCYDEYDEDELEMANLEFRGGGGGRVKSHRFWVDHIWRGND